MKMLMEMTRDACLHTMNKHPFCDVYFCNTVINLVTHYFKIGFGKWFTRDNQ